MNPIKGMPPPDWPALKQDFVTGNMTLADIARSSGIKESTVRNRSTRGGWQEARDEWRRIVAEAATKLTTERRAREMDAFNEADLNVARAMRSQVAAHINAAVTSKTPIGAKELRSLAGAAEAAQRIGRLALGASTESHELTGKDGDPIMTANLTPEQMEQFKEARRRMLAEF